MSRLSTQSTFTELVLSTSFVNWTILPSSVNHLLENNQAYINFIFDLEIFLYLHHNSFNFTLKINYNKAFLIDLIWLKIFTCHHLKIFIQYKHIFYSKKQPFCMSFYSLSHSDTPYRPTSRFHLISLFHLNADCFEKIYVECYV